MKVLQRVAKRSRRRSTGRQREARHCIDTAERVAGSNHNRWFDTSIGRWISEDPTGFTAADTNKYRYVFNSPAGATDASGLAVNVDGTQPHAGEWGTLNSWDPNEPIHYAPATPTPPKVQWHGKEGEILRITSAAGSSPTFKHLYDAVQQIDKLYGNDPTAAVIDYRLMEESR